MAYTKQFTNPHPDGWDDPSYIPPIDVNSMQALTDGIEDIDDYLVANTGDLIVITPETSENIPVKANGHTYVVLTFGETVYDITFVPTPSGGTITYQGEPPVFEANSTYELSFLYLNCIWKKR